MPSMGMKRFLWLWALTLAIFIGYSKAGESILIPPANLQCACSNNQLRFTCTIIVQNKIGTTIWSGTAFTDCDGNRIQLRHSNPDAAGQCNGGAISARNTNPGTQDNCVTSELDVMVDTSLNNKTIRCELNSNSGSPTIGEVTITLVTGPYQRTPGDVNLIDVRPGELTFSWAQIDPNCPTVQYQITSDCGNCSSVDTSATCSNLQLSATERNCTFSVGSMICGFTGPSSNPITVTLKVPDAPQVNLIPVYSSDSQALIRLIIEIQGQMDSFSIYEDISGSVVNYTIHFSSGDNSTISADCTDDICEYTAEVLPPTVCSDVRMVSVSATNRLGSGQPSEAISVGCTNRFVTIDIDSAASTLTCQFQNNPNTIQKTCSVEYSLCSQEQVFTAEGSNTAESSDRVTLQLSLPSGSNCYTYTVRANDGTSTVMVEGRVDSSDETGSNSSAIAAAVVVPIIIFIAIIAAVVISIVFFLKFRPCHKEYHTHNAPLPDSPETKGKLEVISFTNQTHEQCRIDSRENEPDFDFHRGDAGLHGDQEEPNYANGPDNKASDSLGEGAVQEGLESSDDNAVQPENKLEHLGGDINTVKPDNEFSNIGGVTAGVIGGYAGDEDEEFQGYQ